MSTCVSGTISIEKLSNEEKPVSKLVRTSSIEKIKELNNYICSQQYYIIPALLSWIKSSQNGLENTMEKTIMLYRYILCNTIIYRVFKINQVCRDCTSNVKKIIFEYGHTLVDSCYKADFLLKVGLYSAITLVSLQFFMCIYLLFLTYIPVGLFFLISCVASVIFLFYESIKTQDFRIRKQKKL
ncbi:hypothetical protein HHI36_021555 [Cryptolaemus montrouzieri]|uniref:Copper transporter n=1 Tax=Cryptolaemus montrouzieri TaxID=559131 RepID=A0ABD2MXY8_9CUCU